MKPVPASILAVLLFTSLAGAQIPFSQQDETNFNLGIQSFKQADYSTAYLYFRQVMLDSLNQRSQESFYYGTRCLFNLHRYQESAVQIDTFLVRFPNDERKFEMMYILGADYYEMGNYTAAASRFVTAIDSAYDPTVRDRAVASLRSLTDASLTFDDIERVFSICGTRLSAATVAVGFARRAYFSDRLGDAERVLQAFTQRYPGAGTGGSEVARWLSRIAEDSLLNLATVKIGVILPLEYGSGVGDRLLLGVQLALDNYNARSTNKIGMVLKNYGGNVVKLAADMKALASDSEVKAVIGPVFSSEISQVAAAANTSTLPTITPTATQVGLTAGDTYVFQANPNYKTRAEAIADYAADVLHIRKFAILSPEDSYGKTIAGYFTERLMEKGIQPVSTQYFTSGTTDLSRQILKIKADVAAGGEPYVDFAGLNKQQQAKLTAFGIPAAYVDSVANSKGSLDAYDLLGADPIRIADSLGIPVTMRDTLDEFDALRSLGAIFVPLTSSKDIGIVGAQLAYYNVRTQLLGTDDWYDLNQLSVNDPYVDGVIFCSDTYFNTGSPAYIAASDSLSQISDVDLDRTVAYGYDVASMLLSTMSTIGASRQSVYTALRATAFTGLHSMISFNTDNSNHYVYILQYKKGSISDLGELNPH